MDPLAIFINGWTIGYCCVRTFRLRRRTCSSICRASWNFFWTRNYHVNKDLDLKRVDLESRWFNCASILPSSSVNFFKLSHNNAWNLSTFWIATSLTVHDVSTKLDTLQIPLESLINRLMSCKCDTQIFRGLF